MAREAEVTPFMGAATANCSSEEQVDAPPADDDPFPAPAPRHAAGGGGSVLEDVYTGRPAAPRLPTASAISRASSAG